MTDGTFDPKDPAANDVFAVDFAADLAAGETLSTATFAISIIDGLDPAVAAMLSGAASIVGTEARQRVRNGVAGTTYVLKATVTTSAGNTKVGCGILRVEDC